MPTTQCASLPPIQGASWVTKCWASNCPSHSIHGGLLKHVESSLKTQCGRGGGNQESLFCIKPQDWWAKQKKKKKMFNMEEKQIFASVGKGDLQCYLAWNSAAGQAHPVVNHLLTGKLTVPAGYGKGTQQWKLKVKGKLSEAEIVWRSGF